jgi:hypothetical protein
MTFRITIKPTLSTYLKLTFGVVRQYYRSTSCVEILTLSYAEDRLNKNALTTLANYSGKSTRHETAETAKPWVDTCFVEKVPLFLRASETPW